MAAERPLCVQYGCGLSAPDGWASYDCSPTLRMQKIPVLGAIAPGVRFPKAVRLGDVRKRLPVASGSADYAYCSHVLEHLSLDDCRHAIRETFRILRPGGTFRLVLPDLGYLCRQYVAANGDPEAAHAFMERSYLGVKSRPRGMGGLLRSWLGNSEHLWMWDEASMGRELAGAGFIDIRRAEFGDSGVDNFDAVEDRDRWENTLGMQCQKPGGE